MTVTKSGDKQKCVYGSGSKAVLITHSELVIMISKRVGRAASSLDHSPVRAPVPVRTHCASAWWDRCGADLGSFPHGAVPEETAGTSSYYMDENYSAGSEIQRPEYGRRS